MRIKSSIEKSVVLSPLAVGFEANPTRRDYGGFNLNLCLFDAT